MRSRNNTRRSASWAISITALMVVTFVTGTTRVHAQTFSSGSDGSDGVFAPAGPAGTVITFDPKNFSGSQVSANVFNFTTITIPSGVTVKLSGNVINGPVVWLATGDVNIQGTIDASGEKGANYTLNSYTRRPSVPGPGGYAGQVGGNSTQTPLAGDGPGGGAVGNCSTDNRGSGGGFSGNQFLIPLIGGSGGGGGNRCNTADFAPGGGAGGGSLLIASSTQLTIASGGFINANGGDAGDGDGGHSGGAGAGGAIRLVSNIISGNGLLTASGGCNNYDNQFPHLGGRGRIRLEAYTIPFTGGFSSRCVGATVNESAPFALLLTTAGPSTAKVVSIGGVLINANPSTFPDITINTASAIPVVIQTHNIPTTAAVTLTILDQNGAADTVISAPALANCDQSNTCITTVNVVFPFGASRGLTKVSWTQ